MKTSRSGMKTCSKRTFAWVPVSLWLIVIFLFSAQNAEQSGNTSTGIVRWVVGLLYSGFEGFPPEKQAEILHLFQLLVRKGAHFTEYAVLAMLVSNALRLAGKFRWKLPVIISAAYAVTDEIHQYFVPGRACRLLDVIIDTSGAAFGTAIFVLGLLHLKKRKDKRKPAQTE